MLIGIVQAESDTSNQTNRIWKNAESHVGSMQDTQDHFYHEDDKNENYSGHESHAPELVFDNFYINEKLSEKDIETLFEHISLTSSSIDFKKAS